MLLSNFSSKSRDSTQKLAASSMKANSSLTVSQNDAVISPIKTVYRNTPPVSIRGISTEMVSNCDHGHGDSSSVQHEFSDGSKWFSPSQKPYTKNHLSASACSVTPAPSVVIGSSSNSSLPSLSCNFYCPRILDHPPQTSEKSQHSNVRWASLLSPGSKNEGGTKKPPVAASQKASRSTGTLSLPRLPALAARSGAHSTDQLVSVPSRTKPPSLAIGDHMPFSKTSNAIASFPHLTLDLDLADHLERNGASSRSLPVEESEKYAARGANSGSARLGNCDNDERAGPPISISGSVSELHAGDKNRLRSPRFVSKMISRTEKLVKSMRPSRAKSTGDCSLNSGAISSNALDNASKVYFHSTDPAVAAGLGPSTIVGQETESEIGSGPTPIDGVSCAQRSAQEDELTPPPKLLLKIETNNLDVNVPSNSKVNLTHPQCPFVDLSQVRMDQPRPEWVPLPQTNVAGKRGKRALQQWWEWLGRKGQNKKIGTTKSVSKISIRPMSHHDNFPYPIPTPPPSRLDQKIPTVEEQQNDNLASTCETTDSACLQKSDSPRADSIIPHSAGSGPSPGPSSNASPLQGGFHDHSMPLANTLSPPTSPPPPIPARSRSRPLNAMDAYKQKAASAEFLNFAERRAEKESKLLSQYSTMKLLRTSVAEGGTVREGSVKGGLAGEMITNNSGLEGFDPMLSDPIYPEKCASLPWLTDAPLPFHTHSEFPTATEGLQPLANIHLLLRGEGDESWDDENDPIGNIRALEGVDELLAAMGAFRLDRLPTDQTAEEGESEKMMVAHRVSFVKFSRGRKVAQLSNPYFSRRRPNNRRKRPEGLGENRRSMPAGDGLRATASSCSVPCLQIDRMSREANPRWAKSPMMKEKIGWSPGSGEGGMDDDRADVRSLRAERMYGPDEEEEWRVEESTAK